MTYSNNWHTNSVEKPFMTPKKIFLFVILIIVTAISLSPFIYGFYVAINYRIAEISNLSVGYLKHNEVILSKVIPRGTAHLYVCGDLKTPRSNYLAISLHDATEQNFFGRGVSSGPYRAGRFCIEIKTNSGLASGTYKVIIIDQHERVGELLFDVR